MAFAGWFVMVDCKEPEAIAFWLAHEQLAFTHPPLHLTSKRIKNA
jgi:hypothetical protein